MELNEILVHSLTGTYGNNGPENLLKSERLKKQAMLKCESTVESCAKQEQIILEKIAVPTPTGCVPRPRLISLLEQSLSTCNSTIISGRAGSGKTTLAIDLARKSGRAVAWYKVDAPESKLAIFLQYLISSIASCRSEFGGVVLGSRLEDELDDNCTAFLAELFVFELERQSGSPMLIVIEDLHLIDDASWLVPFFRRLLPLLPADVHMLITSRTMPPAPLWRMRSKQTLSVIDEETLAFSRDEAVKLFEQYGLSREQASIALDHSRGRAAALAGLAAKLHVAENEYRNGDNVSRRLKAG